MTLQLFCTHYVRIPYEAGRVREAKIRPILRANFRHDSYVLIFISCSICNPSTAHPPLVQNLPFDLTPNPRPAVTLEPPTFPSQAYPTPLLKNNNLTSSDAQISQNIYIVFISRFLLPPPCRSRVLLLFFHLPLV